MPQNEPFSLDAGGMKIIAEWAVLKSMVVESTKPLHGNEPFYTREERIAFHEHHEIPARTRVWVGALDGFHIGAHTTDFTINGDGGKMRIGTGFVSTIYMGYFVCQVITEHFYPGVPVDQIPPIDPPPGSSDSKLIQIYPQIAKKADWPPATFTNGGPDGIAYLMQRWRQGEKVSMVRKDSVVKLADPGNSPSGLRLFLFRYRHLISLLGALTVFVTFTINDVLRENLKDLSDSLQNARAIYLIRKDLDELA